MNTENFFSDPRLPFAEGRCSMSNARTFKAHMHRRFCIGAVRSGKVHFQAGGLAEALEPGMLALIPPDTLHCCNTPGNAGRSFCMLYLDVPWCLQIQKSLWGVDKFTPTSCARLQDDTLYTQYIEVMEQLMDRREHLLKKEQMLLELVAAIFEKSVPGSQPPLPPCPSGGEVERLKEILSTDLPEELTLADLAEQLATNHYTMLRRFKAGTGITPHAFRMNCRIEQARKYLQQGMDIADVALECGFFDQSHLHRYFKAMTTLTPKAYQVNFIQ